MNNRFRSLFNPAMPHPPGRRRPYFEGWYYKVIDPTEEFVFAIIPGIFYGESPQFDHAFIQLINGNSAQVSIKEFPISQFSSSKQTFDIQIGANHFSAEELDLNILFGTKQVHGALQFRDTKPWPISLLSPGIMGWYAYVPLMQCNHAVVSMDHPIDGMIDFDGTKIDFCGGRGYIEKDWGESFPDAWIWSQSNHFSTIGTSLTASIAIIPWGRTAFPGFIIGLLHEGKLHRFTTYNNSRVEQLNPGEKQIEWVVRNKNHRLVLQIQRSLGFEVYAPTKIDMSGRVPETIDATIHLQLFSLVGGKEHLVYEDTGRHAGLEVAGNIDQLINLWKIKV